MNSFVKIRYLTVALLSLFTIISCKQSENTVVIEDAPTSSKNTDTTAVQETEGPFRQLVIGEINPIRSLDPLFVENSSGMRALQLLYEGLVRYDETGEIIPAVAEDWTISDDNQTYRFTLKNDLFYHDSNIFSNGLGRKLIASDVKFVFDRMASANVPGEAAQLFMNIRGFEPYFREQHQIKQAADRQLKTISGIKAPNDSTITFSLVEPDPDFIKTLATPYAVIYPREAITNNGFQAVGTGPFKLSQKRSDSLYIFAKFENYRISDQPVINRVDIRTSSDEGALLQAMSQGRTQLIPQLGPELMKRTLGPNGQLLNRIAENHTLYNSKGKSAYHIRYNTGADLPESSVANALNSVQQNNFFPALPQDAYEILWLIPELQNSSRPDSLLALSTNNPFVRDFYTQLSTRLANNGINFSVSSSRVAHRNIPLYVDNFLTVRDISMQTPPDTFASIIFKSMALARNDVQNLTFNDFLPW